MAGMRGPYDWGLCVVSAFQLFPESRGSMEGPPAVIAAVTDRRESQLSAGARSSRSVGSLELVSNER